jgi:hypothetical protein
MDKRIIEGVARVGEGMCGSFLPKEKLKIPMKTRFAPKVVLFQKTFAYVNAINICYVKLKFYKLGFQVGRLGLW